MKKLVINVSEGALKQINRIKGMSGADTYTQLIKESLRMYYFLVKEVMKGGKVLVKYKTEYKEIIFKLP